MSSNAKLYTKTVIQTKISNEDIKSRMFRGFSTVSPSSENFSLYDFELIKQDILNHFYVRQGERLMQPTFGTIIWDLLYEPLTEQVKNLIIQNVNKIVNYDPRVSAEKVVVTAYESGIMIKCLLTFIPYNISQQMQIAFDQANGIAVK